jgi:hypothetical protein
MRAKIFVAAAAAALAGSPALACTMVAPAKPLAPAQIEATARAVAQQAHAVLEIEIVRPEAGASPGAVRVLRPLKGPYRRGAVLPALPSGSAACGPDRLIFGKRGVIVLHQQGLPIIVGSFIGAPLAEPLRRHSSAAAPGFAGPQPPGRPSAPGWAGRPMREGAAFQLEARAVHERVRRDSNFAGFIFRHEPEPHAIVRFTGDAEARLRRYTKDPRYRAMGADLTLAELEALKDRMSAATAGLGLRCSIIDGDEARNEVTIQVVEMEKIDRAVAEGRLKVPPKVRFLRGRGCPQLR